ncbi:MAG: hypothetical protein SGI83_02815 [Bacteroidota bacterium]|mgnify:CR=1 FL=1|nr:hypothetical protein [Bacteroidota bacterium]
MTDTPQHIKDLQLQLWLKKTPGERLFQAIIDIEAMREALRDAKMKMGLPLGDLDPVGEYLRKKQENEQ